MFDFREGEALQVKAAKKVVIKLPVDDACLVKS